MFRPRKDIRRYSDDAVAECLRRASGAAQILTLDLQEFVATLP
jgi:hypothetical protein